MPNDTLEITLSYNGNTYTSFIKMIDNLTAERCEDLDWFLRSEFTVKYNAEILGKIIEVPQPPPQ